MKNNDKLFEQFVELSIDYSASYTVLLDMYQYLERQLFYRMLKKIVDNDIKGKDIYMLYDVFCDCNFEIMHFVLLKMPMEIVKKALSEGENGKHRIVNYLNTH